MKQLLALACSLPILSSPVFADDDDHDRHPDWSYFEVGNLQYDMNLTGVDIEPEGYMLGLSLSFGDHLFGVIEANRSDIDSGGTAYDFDREGYGFGYHWDTWYASYTYNTWEVNNFETDVDTIRLGFRDKWSDRFEFNASYTWNDFDGADNEDGFQIGIAFEVLDDFSIVADWETFGSELDVDALMVGVRFDF